MVAFNWCDESRTASLETAECMVTQHDIKDEQCTFSSDCYTQPFSARSISEGNDGSRPPQRIVSFRTASGDITGPLGAEGSAEGLCRELTWRAADRKKSTRLCRANAQSSPQLSEWTGHDEAEQNETETEKYEIRPVVEPSRGIKISTPEGQDAHGLSSTDGSSLLESPSQLRRIQTVGRRDGLVGMIGSSHAQAVSISDGQTGKVYALEVGGEKIAVFKPETGEHFTRRSLGRGQGGVREEAVYLVDRVSSSKAGVPVTSRMDVEVEGVMLGGSVQAFVADAVGFIEDFAMPRDASQASAFVPQQVAEALATLDMRVFNMDRHTGNLLLLGNDKPHGLGPIDHGCCLPPWWKLGEANFAAWHGWAQLREPPCESTRRLAREAAECLPKTCAMVRDVGLEEVAVLTLQICTVFVSVGIGELGIPCSHLAELMLRDEAQGFEKLSWLESKVFACAIAAGAMCRVEADAYGEQEIIVEREGAGWQAEAFLADLEAVFRAEATEAARLLQESRAAP